MVELKTWRFGEWRLRETFYLNVVLLVVLSAARAAQFTYKILTVNNHHDMVPTELWGEFIDVEFKR